MGEGGPPVSLSPAELRGLEALLPRERLLVDADVRRVYGIEHAATSLPLAVVFPENTEETVRIVEYCSDNALGVMPRGAGTNLTGAAATAGRAIVLSTMRMRSILAFDTVDGTIRVGAGIRNLEISEHVRTAGWFYAPDPSSRRSCTIGGNIATNSGGASAFRHGGTAQALAGVTVVLRGGTRIDVDSGPFCMSPDAIIPGVLCGAEGNIGIVTEALLRLVPLPQSQFAAMAAFKDVPAALEAATALLAAGVTPSAADLMDAVTAELCEANFGSGYPARHAILLLKFQGSAAEVAWQLDVAARLCPGLRVEESDGADSLWRGRERIYGAVARQGSAVSIDCSVPLTALASMFEAAIDEAGSSELGCAVAAHLFDGTSHIYLLADAGKRLQAEQAAHRLLRRALSLGGAISAEYGIGRRHHQMLVEHQGVLASGFLELVTEAIAGIGDSIRQDVAA
jgi:glycolate oxidase